MEDLLLLLLLLSCFSCVRLCATPWTAAHQAPPSLQACRCLLQCMKGKVKGKSLSRVQLLATPWTAAHQAPPSMGFSRQEYWSGVPSPSPLSVSRACLMSGETNDARGFPGGSVVKNQPAMQETQVQSLSWEDSLEEETATHSSILAWEIPWTEKPGGLQSTES